MRAHVNNPSRTHRYYFDWLANSLSIRKQEDWYGVKWKEVANKGGSRVLNEGGSHSIHKALKETYPEYTWHPWKFEKCPQSHWHSSSNHRKYFDWLADELRIETQANWYSVEFDTVKNHSGGGLLSGHYGKSLHRALETVYPEYQWHFWKFTSANYYTTPSSEQLRSYFNWLSEELEIFQIEDWTKVTVEDVLDHHGHHFLTQFNNSLSKALQVAFPEFTWNSWMFRAPFSYWKHNENRRTCLDWVAEQLNIDTSEDWYKYTAEELMDTGARGLFFYYSSSHKMLAEVYPEFEWLPWKFEKTSKSFFDSISNQRKYLDWLTEKLAIEEQEQWYQVTCYILMDHGCRTLLANYGKSVYKMLQRVYSEFTWNAWQFSKVPQAFWDSSNNQLQCIQWVESQLGIAEPSEWLKVPNVQLRRNGLGGMLSLYGGSPYKMLSAVYPHYQWDVPSSVIRSMGQHNAWMSLKSILGMDVLMNYRHPQLLHSVSKRAMELDIYIPALQLAFEYQGGQHFIENLPDNLYTKPLQLYRDNEKKEACKQLGISLIEIPYWWDASPSSLISSILKFRPNLNLPSAIATKLLSANTTHETQYLIVTTVTDCP